MKKVLLSVLLLGIIALLTGSYNYRFRGEEPTRIVMAFEMDYFHSFAQPTYLGEPYYRKPPLFNWLVVLSSKIWGWSPFTGRFITILSTISVLVLIYLFALRFIFLESLPAFLSSLIFLGFIDVIFWYGFLSEIDMTLTFLVFGVITSLFASFMEKKKLYVYIYFMVAGFLTGLSFLLKGLPAPVFFFITFLSLLSIFYLNKIIYKENLREKNTFLWKHYLGGFLVAVFVAFVPIIIWVLNLPEPERYIQVLWEESFGRVKASTNIFDFFMHIFYYPLLTVKQTLLISFFVLLFLFKKGNLRFKIQPNNPLFIIMFIFMLNYIPYWISAGARGRYILPILPLLSIIFASYVIKSRSFTRLIIGVLIFTFVVRFAVGLFYFPYETEKKGIYRKIAMDMESVIRPEFYGKVASNCQVHKGLIFYVDVFMKKPVLSERKLPDWKYFIDCKNEKKYPPLKVYNYKNTQIKLIFKD